MSFLRVLICLAADDLWLTALRNGQSGQLTVRGQRGGLTAARLTGACIMAMPARELLSTYAELARCGGKYQRSRLGQGRTGRHHQRT